MVVHNHRWSAEALQIQGVQIHDDYQSKDIELRVTKKKHGQGALRVRCYLPVPMSTRFNSDAQRRRREAGYRKIREAAGIPEPSKHQRQLVRLRNERYRAKQRAEQGKKAA